MAKTKKRPKRVVTKSRVKCQNVVKRRRPIHKRILLHPVSILFLCCVGILLIGSTLPSHAATNSTISATVEAPVLTDPAVITDPTNGSVFKSVPINVSGTCPANSYVVLYRNGQFSGVDLCNNGGFEIQTDLFDGDNNLIAQDFNSTNEAGPSGTTVSVAYNAPSPSSSSSSNSNSSTSTNIKSSSTPANTAAPVLPLIINSQYQYQSTSTSKQFSWPINLTGGTSPYHVNINWGDGSSTNYTFASDPTFYIYHTYHNPGEFVIIINGVDSKGSKSSLQLVAIINSPLAAVAYSNSTGSASSPKGVSGLVQSVKHRLWLIWPIYLLIVALLFSFWLGEHEKFRTLHRKRSAS